MKHLKFKFAHACVFVFLSATFFMVAQVLDSQYHHKATVPEFVYFLDPMPHDLGDLSFSKLQKTKINITFDFRIDDDVARKTGNEEYQNIFQTSDANKGLRLEVQAKVGQTNRWGIVVGSKEGTFKGIDLGISPTIEQWHRFELIIEEGHKSLQVWLDGILLADNKEPLTDFLLDKVVVGSGFSKTRPFHGSIRNFSIEQSSSVLDSRKFQSGVFWVFLVALFLWILGAPPYGGWAKNTSDNDNLKSIRVFFISILIYSIFFWYVKKSFFTLSKIAIIKETLFFVLLIVLVSSIVHIVHSRRYVLLISLLFGIPPMLG